MEISQTPQDITKGKLPRGKEPKPFEDEVYKMEKVNRKKRKIPRWKDSNTYEDIPFAKWDQSFMYDYRLHMGFQPFKDMPDDEKLIEEHDRVSVKAIALYQQQLLNEEANKTQKVDSTKGKLPLGKEPEPFKEEVDKTQKVDSTKGKLPRGKEIKIFRKVDKTQKVYSSTKARGKEIMIFRKGGTKPKIISKNQKLPRWLEHEDFPSSDSDDPFLYAESHGPIELTLDENTEIYDSNALWATVLARLERENKLHLLKEVDETQNVDSTKGKLPSGKEAEPFKGNNHTM
ncbi:hypothetical protein P8452_69153 [Trifolium repens]|nr:hypothetical protein QL285_042631 [Trifolium repens]WJX86905.1 hypothetical protein P8452_69153 [Trifolium repens]